MHSCNLQAVSSRTAGWVYAGILFCLVIFSFPTLLSATEGEGGGEDESTRITADRMDAVRGDNMVIFSGNVVVSQRDFTLHSNKLTVYYTPGGGEVREIVAVGGVRIVQPEREATSEKAVYRRGERVLILTENPIVRQGSDMVSGVKITFYLDEDKSIVEGDEQKRVNAVFHPGKSGDLFEGRERE